ncbi:MAG: hypothetical protein ACR2P0_00530, partial [Acidimicrobiales bacterium]
ELELSPEYYLEVLPQLVKPIGNIHLCGDYTHRLSFLAGAGHSAFRAARALGSSHVVAAEDELEFPDTPRWGRFGVAALAVSGAAGLGGVVVGGVAGIGVSVLATLLLCLTVAWPSILPPLAAVYKAFLAIGATMGAALLAIGAWS